MTGFAGAGQLSKLAFRRDGAVLPACVFGIAALLAITARDLKVLYPTAAGRLAKLPGGTVSAASLLWLCAVALTISTAGLIGLRHRDLGDLGPSRPVGAVRDRIVVYASFEPSQQAAEHDTAQPPK
jgi:putative exporter of polyketide antibiotics